VDVPEGRPARSNTRARTTRTRSVCRERAVGRRASRVDLRVAPPGGTVTGMPATRAPAVNATAAALLGLLHEGPMSGGQLVAAAGERFGSFFSVTRSQVYRELPALAAAGLLEQAEQGPRASRHYAITAAGRRAFRAWLAAGGGTDALRSPLVLRLLHARTLGARQRAELVRSSREAYAERLAALRAAARGEPDPYRKAVAEFAVAHVRAVLRLLDAIPGA
jgi:DNA-binding PadR family transcriptional regulator